MQYTTLLHRTSNGTATISFNRPERLNAVNAELYRELEDAINRAERNPEVRAVVLTGEGRAFCVGADMKEHDAGNRTPSEKREYVEMEQRICAQIQESSKPFIAAVNGYALGAGAEMALSCDFIIMRDDAEIGFPEVRIGTYFGGGVTGLLPRLVGLAKAKELLFLGQRINGTEAERIGLVYKSVAGAEFSDAVRKLAERLAKLAPIPLGLVKAHLRTHHRLEMKDVLGKEAEALLRCMESEDWREGVRAFAEKREPRFVGE